jgi:hypothetical protein
MPTATNLGQAAVAQTPPIPWQTQASTATAAMARAALVAGRNMAATLLRVRVVAVLVLMELRRAATDRSKTSGLPR